MGLVTEKLKIKWSTTSRQHYIDLGYNFTKIGDLFEVDVKDLLHSTREDTMYLKLPTNLTM